ncbi:MAG: cytochrome c [Desulfuromusa sp.]|nr:cytochrome c [Desulfuromusa sp.]
MKITATILLIFFLGGMIPTAAIAVDNAAKINPALELIQVLGCKACHTIHGDGGSLAADLTQIGSRLTAAQIEALLTAAASTREKGFMPSYSTLPKEDLQRISNYLYNLR